MVDIEDDGKDGTDLGVGLVIQVVSLVVVIGNEDLERGKWLGGVLALKRKEGELVMEGTLLGAQWENDDGSSGNDEKERLILVVMMFNDDVGGSKRKRSDGEEELFSLLMLVSDEGDGNIFKRSGKRKIKAI